MWKEILRSIIYIMVRGFHHKGLTKRIKKVKIIQAEKGTSSSIFLAKRAAGWCKAEKKVLCEYIPEHLPRRKSRRQRKPSVSRAALIRNALRNTL